MKYLKTMTFTGQMSELGAQVILVGKNIKNSTKNKVRPGVWVQQSAC